MKKMLNESTLLALHNMLCLIIFSVLLPKSTLEIGFNINDAGIDRICLVSCRNERALFESPAKSLRACRGVAAYPWPNRGVLRLYTFFSYAS